MALERRKDDKGRVLKEGEYQRGNGTYEYKWRDRRSKRHSIYAKTLEELREKERDILHDILDGVRADKSSLTINNLFDMWMQLKRGLRDNTLSTYAYMYQHYVQPDFGENKIIDLKRSDIRAFYNTLADEQHINVNSIDSIHTVLHQVLELGVEDEYLRSNPADRALQELKKAHNYDSPKHKALTVAQEELFERFLREHKQYQHWYPFFEVMLWTGMRIGEITGLRWCDVDFENECISVNHTLVYYSKRDSKKNVYAINTPKTEAGKRRIPMLSRVKEALILEKQFQREVELECSAVVDGYTDFIFLNRFGNVQHQGTVNKALKRIIRDCNYEVLDQEPESVVLLPPFSSHALRHTFTTRMCEAGINVKAMQSILGHADAETTLNIYADATEELKSSEMAAFENCLKDFKVG